jgi:hypothetical protein
MRRRDLARAGVVAEGDGWDADGQHGRREQGEREMARSGAFHTHARENGSSGEL